MIQNMFRCIHYTPDENLNKTCDGKNRCVIYYEETCYKYEGSKYGEIFLDKKCD